MRPNGVGEVGERQRAACRRAAAAATASSMRSVLSTTEYSLCRRRWTKDGAGIEAKRQGRRAGLGKRGAADCYNSTSVMGARRFTKRVIARTLRRGSRARAVSHRACGLARAARSCAPAARPRRPSAAGAARPRAPPRARAAAATGQPAGLSARLSPGLRRRLRHRRAAPRRRTPARFGTTATTASAGWTALSQCKAQVTRCAIARAAMTPSQLAVPSTCAAWRYHVRTWGDRAHRKLILLHGWMDVSASFQFLVDALAQRLARARARLARLRPVADAAGRLLVRGLRRRPRRAGRSARAGERVDHRRAQPRRQRRAALRRRRARRGVAARRRSMASAFPPSRPSARPRSCASGSMRCAIRLSFAPYRDLAAVADRLQKTNPRLPRDKAEFLAPHWAEALPDGTARLRADPKHKLPFPTLDRMDEHVRRLARDQAPVLWVEARNRTSAHWLARRRRCRRPRSRAVSRTLRTAARVRSPMRATCCTTTSREAVARALEAFLPRRYRCTPRRRLARSCTRGAPPTWRCVVLTLLWGSNWMAMKFALAARAIRSSSMSQRTWLARDRAVRGAASRSAGRCWPTSWVAVLVTGFFQTTINFGSTTMALAGGGVGRTSVLVFTMPFWTLLLAWPVLHERVRGASGLPWRSRWPGSCWWSQPWDWQGDLAPKLWAVLSGFGWAAGTVATKYFQRARALRSAQLHRVADAAGRAAADRAAAACSTCRASDWSVTYVLMPALRRRPVHGRRLPAVDRRAALPAGGHGVAQHVRDPGDRAGDARWWSSASGYAATSGSASPASARALRSFACAGCCASRRRRRRRRCPRRSTAARRRAGRRLRVSTAPRPSATAGSSRMPDLADELELRLEESMCSSSDSRMSSKSSR